MNSEKKCALIEALLREIIELIVSEIIENPYSELDKAMKIASQKNINQLPSINKMLKNVSIMLYNRRLNVNDKIFEKLDEIYILLD